MLVRKLKTELKKYRGKDDDEIDIEEEEKLRKQLAQKEELSNLLHEQLKVCFFLGLTSKMLLAYFGH